METLLLSLGYTKSNNFVLSVKNCIEATNAIGITAEASFVYANEADLLNVALFGITAKE